MHRHRRADRERQVAVFLTYAAHRGHALIDRALYLPKSWTGEQARCTQAGIPDSVEFATKPALATAMITRAVQAGVAAAWMAGDEVYGADPNLRRTCRGHGLGYVLQIAANRRVPTHAGLMRADALPALIPASGWQTYSWGRVSKGHRDYSWAWIGLLPEPDQQLDSGQDGRHHLLVRRNSATGELVYLRCYTPRPTSLEALVRVAGQRWRIEESFQSAKGLTGLDQHQVRRWTSWHRWSTLAILAHAFLAVATALEHDHDPTPTEMIELTVNEFRRLFDAVLLAARHTITTLRPNHSSAREELPPTHRPIRAYRRLLRMLRPALADEPRVVEDRGCTSRQSPCDPLRLTTRSSSPPRCMPRRTILCGHPPGDGGVTGRPRSAWILCRAAPRSRPLPFLPAEVFTIRAISVRALASTLDPSDCA